MSTLSQDDVNLIANSMFAKSRFKDGSFISKTTGQTVGIESLGEVMAFHMTDDDTETIMRKTSMIYESLKTLSYVQANEREILEDANPKWKFFATYFKDMYGVKASLSLLFKAYVNEFRNTSKREFNDDIAQWCLEMNLPRTVKNEGVVKKIIVIR